MGKNKMLNAIWAVMILLAVLYGAVTGHMGDVTNAALDSAGEAISLCITMAGVVALWMGLMEIAQKAGLVRKLTKGISPFLRFLFPRIPSGHPAGEYIAANVIANVLGLGWACTPAGLKAMEELARHSGGTRSTWIRKAEKGIFAGRGMSGNSSLHRNRPWEKGRPDRQRGSCERDLQGSGVRQADLERQERLRKRIYGIRETTAEAGVPAMRCVSS